MLYNCVMHRPSTFPLSGSILLAMSFGCGGDTKAPSSSPRAAPAPSEEPTREPSGSVQVYRLDGRYYDRLAANTEGDGPLEPPANHFRRWPILETKVVEGRLAREIRSAADDAANFGGNAKDCFWPGLGISLTDGNDQTDLVICLHCDWLYRYQGENDVQNPALNLQGKEEFTRLYREIFGSDEE